MNNLLEIRDLKVWFGRKDSPVRAVDGVNLDIPAGSTVALVGESGCGKSVTALSLARLVPEPPGYYAGGSIMLDGEDVLKMSARQLAGVRGRKIAYVFQEPGDALNPVLTVGYQIMEAVKLHRKGVAPYAEAVRLMNLVGLPQPELRIRAYPHQLSGGMQQRAMIAMALACSPELLVADEPTTALDVTIQAQILELLVSLQKQTNMAVLIITHNLGLVADMAHSVNVMYAGRIVESGPVKDVLSKPAHHYTRGLLDAVPKLFIGQDGGSMAAKLQGIKGSVPDPAKLPTACKFAPRCTAVQDQCRGFEPELKMICEKKNCGRMVRCYYPLI